MSIIDFYGWMILISPLLGFVFSLVVGKFYRKAAGPIASFFIFLSFIFAAITFFNVQKNTIYNSYDWFYNIHYGIYIDHLAIVMALMVSFVSLMIHLFAVYYMKADPNKHAYFAETSLFTAGMLGLVISSNLVVLFLFWELVGLCSYLLIGFWYFKPNATAAAKKAFIVTRVGDLSFLIGMAVLYYSLMGITNDPLSIPYLIQHAQSISTAIGPTRLGVISVFILGAAVGKSAQFPLHVWIPDAMEGPTTVSALIHAATMVTAGVYLVARLFQIFLYSAPFAMYSVAIIGSFTALYAGILGLVVNDLKRILAYSTISQLGYMMAAIGLAPAIGGVAVSLGMFHLVSHAIFKALLFMGAGAFLIAMMDLRDTKQMGGLWKRMPIVTTTFFIASLSLAAFPGTSGFFSKDPIIYASWNYFTSSESIGHFLPVLFLMIGSLLTTLYTFRLFFLVAVGKPRSKLAENARDPPFLATIPLIILSIFALILGLWQTQFYKFLMPSFITSNIVMNAAAPTAPWYITSMPVILLAIGFFIDLYIYGFEKWKTWDISKSWYYKLVKNKFYVDVLYTRIISERVILPLSASFSSFENAYNTGVNDLGSDTVSLGSYFRRLQSGIVENYIVFILLASVIVFIIVELVELI